MIPLIESANGTVHSKKKPMKSKQSINFELCSVEIGQWKQVAEREGTIVGKCFFAKKELVWEFLPVSDQKKVRMVIRWTKIIAASFSELDGGNGLLEIELNEKPTFDEEKDVHSKHSSYIKAFDFTDGNASKYRRHRIEMAPHIISRYFLKLKEDDDTPLQKALEHPFQYGPSSTFEAAPEPTVHESTHWFDHQQLRSEPLPVIQPPNKVQGSTSPFYPSFQPQLTEFPGSRIQQPVHIAKRVKLDHITFPPCSVVREARHRSDPLLQPQQTEDTGSWTRGPIMHQRTNLEPTIPSAVHGTTNRFYPPYQPQQTEESGSWTPGLVIPYQTMPEQTIPNAVYDTIYMYGPPIQPQQTEESGSWTPEPGLHHQTKPEPTIPNAVYGTTSGFNPPFRPQQTGESSSCTLGPVLHHQTKPEPTIPNAVYGTPYGFNPPFEPQQTGESSSYTSGPVLHHQTKPEPTIPNAIYGSPYGFNPPFQPQQTGDSSSCTSGPVLHHQTKSEPTIPNAVYWTTNGFDSLFQPQQTGESSSWTPGHDLPHQINSETTIPNAVYDTTHVFDPRFQPQQTEVSSSWPQEPVPTMNMVQHMPHWSDIPAHTPQTAVPSSWTQGLNTSQPGFNLPLLELSQYRTQPDPATQSRQEPDLVAPADFLPFDTDNLDPHIADPSMTFQGPSDSDYTKHYPTGLDSIQPGQH